MRNMWNLEYLKYFCRTRWQKALDNLKLFLKSYPPITEELVAWSTTISYKSYVKKKIIPSLYKSFVTFFSLLGFFSFLLQIKQETNLADQSISLILIAIIIISIIFSSDSFIKLGSFLFYWYFILNIPYFYSLLHHSNPWLFYLYLYTIIAFVRPLGNFAIESFFFFIIKRYYKKKFFRKILVYVSPNFTRYQDVN